jgi:hypothetical protein
MKLDVTCRKVLVLSLGLVTGVSVFLLKDLNDRGRQMDSAGEGVGIPRGRAWKVGGCLAGVMPGLVLRKRSRPLPGAKPGKRRRALRFVC